MSDTPRATPGKGATVNRRTVLLSLLAVFVSATEAITRRATCTGDNPCNACKNCKYCKRCAKDGKTCGTCRRAMAEAHK